MVTVETVLGRSGLKSATHRIAVKSFPLVLTVLGEWIVILEDNLI
jgi:hypothetical protein